MNRGIKYKKGQRVKVGLRKTRNSAANLVNVSLDLLTFKTPLKASWQIWWFSLIQLSSSNHSCWLYKFREQARSTQHQCVKPKQVQVPTVQFPLARVPTGHLPAFPQANPQLQMFPTTNHHFYWSFIDHCSPIITGWMRTTVTFNA